jgi:hypothetical protein
MKKTMLCLVVLCSLGGCVEIEGQKDPETDQAVTYKGVPVAINVRGEALPVEVKTELGEGIPVKLALQNDKILPVTLNIQEDDSLPVEIKLPQGTLGFVAIAGGVFVLIAVVSCIAAIFAASSAKSISQSIDALNKAQQQRQTEPPNNQNG